LLSLVLARIVFFKKAMKEGKKKREDLKEGSKEDKKEI
jgi:hypothetical protein